MKLHHCVLAVCGISIIAILSFPAPSSAHTSFESSVPADGSRVVGEIDEVVVRFSSAADPAGEGFVALDTTGTVREPDRLAANAARTSWRLHFDPPLSNGIVGVRWTVQAADTHPISGAFSFTVDATPTIKSADADAADPETNDGTLTNPGEAGEPADDSQTSPGLDQTPSSTQPSSSLQVLDAFLNESPASAPGVGEVDAFGRLLGIGGTMLAIGGLGFAVFVIRDRRRDVVSVLKAVGYAGLMVVAGSAVEFVAHLTIANMGWPTSWDESAAVESVVRSTSGLAIAMRAAAGLVIFRAAKLMARSLPLYLPATPSAVMALAGSDGNEVKSVGLQPANSPPAIDERTDGARVSPIMMVGALGLLASFTLEGHTVTEGNRWITGAVDMIHVVAGSIWAGGVVALAVVLWHRHRRAQRLNALELAVRFSVISGGAFAVAGLAGAVLAATILDSVSELWSTSWGRLLVAKFVVVAAAALLGTYNHFVVIPRLEANAGDDTRSVELRNTVTVEAFFLVVVITITAFLVGASAQ